MAWWRHLQALTQSWAYPASSDHKLHDNGTFPPLRCISSMDEFSVFQSRYEIAVDWLVEVEKYIGIYKWHNGQPTLQVTSSRNLTSDSQFSVGLPIPFWIRKSLTVSGVNHIPMVMAKGPCAAFSFILRSAPHVHSMVLRTQTSNIEHQVIWGFCSCLRRVVEVYQSFYSENCKGLGWDKEKMHVYVLLWSWSS